MATEQVKLSTTEAIAEVQALRSALAQLKADLADVKSALSTVGATDANAGKTLFGIGQKLATVQDALGRSQAVAQTGGDIRQAVLNTGAPPGVYAASAALAGAGDNSAAAQVGTQYASGTGPRLNFNQQQYLQGIIGHSMQTASGGTGGTGGGGPILGGNVPGGTMPVPAGAPGPMYWSPAGPSLPPPTPMYSQAIGPSAPAPLNPFAGAPAIGPNSVIGTPGYQANAYAFQQAQQRQEWAQQQGLIARTALAAGIGHTVGQGLSLYASQTASGDYDPMAGAGLYGSAAGGLIGGVVGAVTSPGAPGVGAATGILVGGQLGSAAAQALVAPFVRQKEAILSVQSVAARQGVDPTSITGYSYGELGTRITGNPLHPSSLKINFDIENRRNTPGDLDRLQEDVSFSGKNLAERAAIKAGVYAGTDIISLKQTAQTYSTLGSANLEAGEDAGDALASTERLARKFFMGAPAQAQRAAPVIAARNRMGNNVADLLLNFGPEAFGAFADATGVNDITPRQTLAYRDVQTAQRAESLGALQNRGSGAATAQAFGTEMAAIGVLPGGRSSLVYAQAAAQQREAQNTAFSQSQALAFDVPLTRIQGALNRLDVQPYAPGSRLALSAQAVSVLNQGIAATGTELQRGNLTEQRYSELVSRQESQMTARSQAMASITSGIDDRIPALFAGAGPGLRKFSSNSLAAEALREAGLPYRDFGASNGEQLGQQQAAYARIGLGSPTSRAFNADNARIGIEKTPAYMRDPANFRAGDHTSTPSADASPALLPVLERIAATLERIAGGNGPGTKPNSTRNPGERYGNLNANVNLGGTTAQTVTGNR